MDNWSRGWRKLVEWDSINKVYLYKGYKIIPLSYSDQIKLPNHLQNEYYWGEISHIDNVLKNKNNKILTLTDKKSWKMHLIYFGSQLECRMVIVYEKKNI